MNEEVIFDSFTDIGNVIVSYVVYAVSYLHSRDIVPKDIKPASVLVSNSHYKSFKHDELEMAFGKTPTVCKLAVIWDKPDLCIHKLMLLLAKAV